MKRITCFAFILCLLLAVSACGTDSATGEMTVNPPVTEYPADETNWETGISESARNTIVPQATEAPARTTTKPATQRPSTSTVHTTSKTSSSPTRNSAASTSSSTTERSVPLTTTVPATPPVTTIATGNVMKAVQSPSSSGTIAPKGPGSIYNAGLSCKSEKAVYSPGDEQIFVVVRNESSNSEAVNPNYELQKWNGSQWKEYSAWAQWTHNPNQLSVDSGGGKAWIVPLEGYTQRTEGLYRILFWCSGGNETTAYTSAVFEINNSGVPTYTVQELKEMFFLFR